jgi:hypothetical protein
MSCWVFGLLVSLGAVSGLSPRIPRPGSTNILPATGMALAATPAAESSKPSLRKVQGGYVASIFVPTTLQQAWRTLTNYPAMAGQMPDIKAAKVLQRNGNQLQLAQTYQAPYTFGQTIRAILLVQETPKSQISYRLLRGDRIRKLQGAWALTPIHGGVIVNHTISVDPDIPDFLRPIYFELCETNLLNSMATLRTLMLAP